ncbi:MAG: hypothetical protein CVU90_00460 [Firmicutes bacterium HGW-Firmicutes-15]|nr:MAG: hypothetical protein CVU90_00460 [Firmicutes bacterium HGW-Firmicutes-15]
MTRCAYCKKQGADKKTSIHIWENGSLKTMKMDYCSGACKQNILDFVKSHNKFAPYYGGIALVWLLLFLAIPFAMKAITGNPKYISVGSPAMIALMGVILVIFPLGLSNTKYYERLGIKLTTLFIRLTGLLMVFTGINMIWTAV